MKRPLRILTVADVPPDPNSGASGTVYHTNVALRELGHEVDEIWADDLGPRVIRHGNLHSLLEQPRTYRRAVLQRVAKRDYDVVMMSQPQAYLAAKALKQRGFPGLVINRSHGVELRVNAVLPDWHHKLGVPESRFPRSLLTPVIRNRLARQWEKVAKWSDGIIVPSVMDREFLLNALPIAAKRVRTVHHGVPAEFLNRSLAPMTPQRARKILYVGQYAFIKGVSLLPEIVDRVLHRCRDATFTWVTAGSAHSEIGARLDKSIRNRVTLREWLPQGELPKLYDEHGLFVFPSLFEGAGKAALEAMSRGLCVVAAETGAMPDYIREGYNGLLCPVGDTDSFVERLVESVGDLSRLASISTEAARTAAQHSWQRCASAACDFYGELLQAKCRSRVHLAHEDGVPR